MNDNIHVKWDGIDIGANHIAQQIAECEQTQPEYIIGLARGGLIPAVIISHALNIPMIAANYSSVNGRGDDRNHDNKLPPIVGPIVSGTGQLPHMPELLLVDDLTDSGNTMREVYDHYTGLGHKVRTACLYHKEGSVHVPDFCWKRLPEDAGWIIFPFEN